MLNQEEYAGRLDRLQERLEALDLDGALLTHPIDIYYFSGTRQNGVLWVPRSGDARLLARKSLARAMKETTAVAVVPFPSSREFAATLPAGIHRVGLTFDVLPHQQYQYYGKLLPTCEFADISAAVRELRSVKSAGELTIMRRGAERLCGVFAEIPAFLHKGMREVDLAAEFEMRLRKAGGEGYVRMRAFNQELFLGLAVAGDSACTPGFFDGAVTGPGMSSAAPHGASTAEIGENMPIMVDYTGIFNGYILDMTRMFVIGDLAPELQEAFETALAIQRAMSQGLRPGTIAAELFEQAATLAGQAGLGDRFMGAPGEQARFVGHGVGLELDELPVLAKGFNVPLQLGQTIAIEPKFVFPGQGVVGIENTFVVGTAGGERLTGLADDLVRI